MKASLISALFLLLVLNFTLQAQSEISSSPSESQGGWVSMGIRSTSSAFSHDGFGIGAGGQFRVQFSNRVNTDWFADYIEVSNKNNVRSMYVHVGWSVLFYPFKNLYYPKNHFQPFILAGHCFDYNKKTVITQPQVNADRWGSAVQAGLGTHIHLSQRFDITFMAQYMIHLTKELEVENENGVYHIDEHPLTGLEGHLLTTVSVNYKLFRLWKKSKFLE